jgi:hypothetical protein
MDWSNPWILLVAFAAILAFATSVCRTLLGQREHARRPGAVAPYLLLFATSLLGTTAGMVAAFKATATAIPDEKATMLAVGVSLALDPVRLALLLTMLLALLDGLGVLVGSARNSALKPPSRVGLAFFVGTGLLCLTGTLNLLRAGQSFIMNSASEEAGRAVVSSMIEAVGAAGATYTVVSSLALGPSARGFDSWGS